MKLNVKRKIIITLISLNFILYPILFIFLLKNEWILYGQNIIAGQKGQWSGLQLESYLQFIDEIASFIPQDLNQELKLVIYKEQGEFEKTKQICLKKPSLSQCLGVLSEP